VAGDGGRSETNRDKARPTRTPSAMATNVSTVDVTMDIPELSPCNNAATPTRPSARDQQPESRREADDHRWPGPLPGHESRDGCHGGCPDECRENASERQSPENLSAIGDVQHEKDPAERGSAVRTGS
jgi:hypothetical protein